MSHQVDQRVELPGGEPFQVEHSELAIEQDIMNRRAVQPEGPLALDLTQDWK